MAAKVWIDGRTVDLSAARVPVTDRGFLYGDSVYEVLRTFDGRPFGLEPHLDRLERSAQSLEMRLPTRAAIVAAVQETLEAAAEPNAYVRIIVTRGGGEIALDPAAADAPRLIVICQAAKLPEPRMVTEGVEVAIVGRSRSAGQPSNVNPAVKSGNYLVSVLAVADARRQGAYEAILSDGQGCITEGGSSNFFVVQGGRIATPPLSAGLLEGITRRTVLELCRSVGLAAVEQPLRPEDLKRADEAFLTSSVRGVLPITRVDGGPVGSGTPGPVTRRIIALYDERARRA